MNKEIWVKIDDYDDYFISNEGQVMSTKNNKIKYLKAVKNGSGYLHVNLFKNGKHNNINNLRWVTHQQNSFNTKAKGYYLHKQINKWHARIRIDNKLIQLGYYDLEEEAREAYLKAKEKYHIID